jgi:uncharacterized protein (TIGR02466 family)
MSTERTVEKHELFPSPVWITHLNGFANHHASMLTYLDELRENDPGLGRSTVLGWHSPDQLHETEVFAPLAREVTAMLEGPVAADARLDLEAANFRIKKMWAVWNPKYAFNFLHRHPHCIFSGVYYLQCEEDAGELNFHDPRADVRMVWPPLAVEDQGARFVRRYTPEVGRLMMFPAWFPHDVSPNLSDTPRVAVSFDIVCEER